MAEGQEQNFEYEAAHAANEKLGGTSEGRNILSGPEGIKVLEEFEENAQLKFELQKIRKEKDEATEKAGRDELTGLYNRRHMVDYIEGLIKEGSGFSIIFFDIDHFKDINDNFGHDKGDEVLKWLAKRLSANSRDEVGRWGGEEFMIVVKNPYNIREILDTAERLKTEVSEFSEKAVKYGKGRETLPTKFTISAGCAILRPEDNKDWMTTFKRADIALYAAKQQGRDRVMFNDTYFSGPQNV